MRFEFDAEEVSIGPSSASLYYVSVTVDGDANDVFEAIKERVDHDNLLACLTREEVIKYFEIEEEEGT